MQISRRMMMKMNRTLTMSFGFERRQIAQVSRAVSQLNQENTLANEVDDSADKMNELIVDPLSDNAESVED